MKLINKKDRRYFYLKREQQDKQDRQDRQNKQDKQNKIIFKIKWSNFNETNWYTFSNNK